MGNQRSSRWVLLVCALFIGCGGGDDDGGDGVGPDGGGGNQCSSVSDTCAGETICVNGTCAAAFGRIYDVRNVAVAVPTTDPNGESWDIGGGAPDLLIQILVNGQVAATSTAVPDQFSASFPGPFAVQPIGGASFLVQAYDEDISANDPAFGCQATPLTAELLRGRQLQCANGGSSLTFRIDPR